MLTSPLLSIAGPRVETSFAGQNESAATANRADLVLEIVARLAAELHPSRQAPSASLDGRLEHDYGFDSLGRVELFLRLERRFGVSIPQSAMESAETPRDLLRAVQAANPASRAAPR